MIKRVKKKMPISGVTLMRHKKQKWSAQVRDEVRVKITMPKNIKKQRGEVKINNARVGVNSNNHVFQCKSSWSV